jgi:hypothetical protein
MYVIHSTVAEPNRGQQKQKRQMCISNATVMWRCAVTKKGVGMCVMGTVDEEVSVGTLGNVLVKQRHGSACAHVASRKRRLLVCCVSICAFVPVQQVN